MSSPNKTQEQEAPSSSDNWKQRIIIPTILAGIVGGGVGLVSKHRKIHGLSNISATYATNFAIVTGCYCGAREFVRVSRKSTSDDLLNSAIGGFGCGAILGRLQGGVAGAVRYSFMFAAAGTALDFAAPKIQSYLQSLQNDDSWLKLPEWSPIQVLDEEALAAKREREQQMLARRNTLDLNKEEA
ncbi:hypothetical protein DCAR_0314359 [Daucus carota subsp. sativus]|uniref:Uncharacterized protein n=1 Tax=Daucus carota subsp. sativus TaxID=79200 RepID=A0A169WIJ1_DAUCS|nr:PREDICTED: uncharacterized protein LOC108211612 [Daucus carota subsp. sativus]WOG95057.1 hypothetical protein DCAR_0314359 [Daucus carota subsp. sativus]